MFLSFARLGRVKESKTCVRGRMGTQRDANNVMFVWRSDVDSTKTKVCERVLHQIIAVYDNDRYRTRP